MCVCVYCHFSLQSLFEENEAVKIGPSVDTVKCTYSAKCCSVVCDNVVSKRGDKVHGHRRKRTKT